MFNTLEIDEAVLDCTRACPNSFQCLTVAHLPACPVVKCINGRVHFVHVRHMDPCPYKLTWGDGHVCTCPTRKGIYSRYGI